MDGTPLSLQIAEAAQRRLSNATFRGSPTNSAANSPAVSTETSRESVAQSRMRTPTTAAPDIQSVDSAPKYNEHRQISRIPVPASGNVSSPGPFPGAVEKACAWDVPSPAQSVDSAQNDVTSFALACEDSVSMSTIDEYGFSQRQPSCAASASSVDLDSASGREGILFEGGIQSPAAQDCVGDKSGVPQTPMLSASAGETASPDSLPDSAYNSSEKRVASCTPKTENELDADSVASLGSYLELEHGSEQQTPSASTLPETPAHTQDILPPQSAAEGTGFTFSALSVTPTHGSPQNHFFHQPSRNNSAKRKLVFNKPPSKIRNRKPEQKQKSTGHLLWRLAAVVLVSCGLYAAYWAAIQQDALWRADFSAFGQASHISAIWRDVTMQAESMAEIRQAVTHMARRYWVIARYNVSSWFSVFVPASSVVDEAGMQSDSAEQSLLPASQDAGADLLSSVSTLLHQAKDEASLLLSSASALWDGEGSACSSAGCFIGACTGGHNSEAPVDIWHMCSTEQMCIADSVADSESSSVCGLFQSGILHQTPLAHSSTLGQLSQVAREAQKYLASAFAMSCTQFITSWDAAKHFATQWAQLRPSLSHQVHLPIGLTVWRNSAEQLRSFMVDKAIQLPIRNVAALVLMVVACFLMVTALAVTAARSVAAPKASPQGGAPLVKAPEGPPVKESAPFTRRSTRIGRDRSVPAAGATPSPTISQDQTFCTAATHRYSLRSRPSPRHSRHETDDTATTPHSHR